jgi:hypothetical protein
MSDLVLEGENLFFHMLLISVDCFLTGELGILKDHGRAALANSYNVSAFSSQMHNEFSFMSKSSTSLALSWTCDLDL